MEFSRTNDQEGKVINRSSENRTRKTVLSFRSFDKQQWRKSNTESPWPEEHLTSEVY